MVRGEQVQTPPRTALSLLALSLNFVRAAKHTRQVTRLNEWRKPLSDFQALNVDASFSVEDGLGACGAVVRDHNGGFIGASTARMEHVPDVVSAEAEAMRQGLIFLQSLGCSKVSIQSDSIIVVEALNNNEGYSLVAAPILDDCRILLKEFGKVYINFCNRESNCVAHELASFGRCNPPTVWSDTPPSFLLKFLADDVSIF